MLTVETPISLIAEFVPMLSGMLEMVIRVMIIILFVSDMGFVATAWANTAAG